MAGGIKKFLDFIKLGNDEDDFMDDDQYEEDEEEPVANRRKLQKSEDSSILDRKKTRTVSDDNDTVSSSIPRREFSSGRTERSSSGKVVPLKSIKSMEVSIQKPNSFEDSEEICDLLLKGQAVVVNLEGLDSGDAQRIIDLIYGCIYAIGGKLNQISKYIFIFSPENIDVLGDITFDVNGVPTFNNEF